MDQERIHEGKLVSWSLRAKSSSYFFETFFLSSAFFKMLLPFFFFLTQTVTTKGHNDFLFLVRSTAEKLTLFYSFNGF